VSSVPGELWEGGWEKRERGGRAAESSEQSVRGGAMELISPVITKQQADSRVEEEQEGRPSS
jgi:hypothetical protein